MDIQEFIKQLNKVQDLMKNEQYEEAAVLLEELKEIEKSEDFGYNLTHRLYQLDSNLRSLYNQQLLLKHIITISKKQKSITFSELNAILKKDKIIDIDDSILGREIELLILRGHLSSKIEGSKIIF